MPCYGSLNVYTFLTHPVDNGGVFPGRWLTETDIKFKCLILKISETF